MRLTLCSLFNMNYHFVNTYYYCIHFSNDIVLFLSLLHTDRRVLTHTLFAVVFLFDVGILMMSNTDGNDIVHSSSSLSLFLSPSLSHRVMVKDWGEEDGCGF